MDADPVNRALSTANACLYGLVHGAIVALGFATGLGFVHTGKRLAFVYDIADLYKVDVTVPVAFEVAAEGVGELERRVRRACRDRFHRTHLITRMVPDIQRVLGLREDVAKMLWHGDGERLGLWDPELGELSAGRNWAPNAESFGGEVTSDAACGEMVAASWDEEDALEEEGEG